MIVIVRKRYKIWTYVKCEIIDELDFREIEQIPQVMVKLTEGQVLQEFLLEEDIDFQERDNW